MRLGSLNRLGIPLAVVTVALGAYVGSNYVAPGNYAQSGGYTGLTHVIDSSIDAAIPVLSVAITDSADPVITGGDAYAYSVILTNSGAAAATTVSVATTLDSSLAYVSSSGTGWSCSAASQVVTCTAASIANGTAPTITINVTTGGSGVSASSSVVASASNATNATASQGTTVNLVNKDATLGWYLPQSSTEWTNFIARKGLSISAPDAIWLLQEASGNPADSGASGVFTLTASGTGISYQQTVTGIARKAITFTDAGTGALKSTNASLPNISTTSQFTAVLTSFTGSPGAQRSLISQGATTKTEARSTLSKTVRAESGANQLDGSTVVTGWQFIALQENHTGAATTVFTHADKVVPTHSASLSGQAVTLGNTSNSSAPVAISIGYEWHGANAEMSSANWKATLQAMGATITFN